MGRFGQIKLLPKALKGYPKSNKSANLVTLVRIDKSNTFDNFYVSLSLSLSLSICIFFIVYTNTVNNKEMNVLFLKID